MFLMKRDVQNTFGLSPNILIFYYIVSNFTAYMADSPGMTKFECNVPSELNLSLNILARILPSMQLTKIMEEDKPISEAPIIWIYIDLPSYLSLHPELTRQLSLPTLHHTLLLDKLAGDSASIDRE